MTSPPTVQLPARREPLAAASAGLTWMRRVLPRLRRAAASPPHRVLFIDDQLPVPGLGAGLPRAHSLVRALHDAGAVLTHYPLHEPLADAHAREQAVPSGVECILGPDRPGLADFLRGRRGQYDRVLISRPHNMAQFLRCCDDQVPDFLAGARLIYDAEALFAPREALRRQLLGEPADGYDAATALATEFNLARRAHTVIAVTEAEATQFRDAGCGDVRVIGHALRTTPTRAPFEGRHGLLFVGRLLEEGSPNADSLRWFVREVMPLLDARIGTGWHLDIVGACAPAMRDALASARLRFHGRLPGGEAMAARYAAARVFIAPTRFAAGIPHKVQEAAAFGLPPAVTRLLARQVGWKDGDGLCSGDSAEQFAAACARLHEDRRLWRRVRRGALRGVERDCHPRALERQIRALLAG